MRKYLLAGIFLAVVLAGVGYWYLHRSAAAAVSYRTEPVARGELLATVSATGTLEPEDVIDVGAQVVGMIKDFGTAADGRPVDYGSPVEPGTVLARIDDAIYKSKVAQTRAQLDSARQRVTQAKAKAESARAKVDQARANTQRSEADLLQAVAKLNQATRDWERVQKLTGAVSTAEYDAAKATYETSDAAVAVAKAAIVQSKAAEADAVAAVADADAAVGDAEATVATTQAILAQDEINLGYCTITSPVKGTVIDRRVTIGQTVQSAFNTPSLFLIARDLKRMKVWASVNEADIAQVRIGQPVRFTVDAHPGETFRGTVSRIRLNATNTQNVVVYTVEVITDNPDGKLLPYMTANLQFEVEKRSDALLVPNSALRYKPPGQGAGRGPGKGQSGGDKPGQGTVWVEEGGKLKPVAVKLGLSDGNQTEVLSGDLQPGQPVVVGEVRAASSDTAGNPFAPKLGGGKKQ